MSTGNEAHPHGHEHAWKFFELHAKQRMQVFNFFVVLAGLMLTGAATSIRAAGDQAPVVAVVLGSLLTVTSVVFWKLDSRTRERIRAAEEVLRSGDTGALSQLFARPEVDAHRMWRFPLSYSAALRVVFFLSRRRVLPPRVGALRRSD